VLGGSLLEYLSGFAPWVAWLTLGSGVVSGLIVWQFRHRLKRLIFGEDEPGGRAPQPAS
jgi:hypothetical protein